MAEWEAVQAMPLFFEQLEGSIRLKSCSASLGCPQPVQQGGYDWSKLEQSVPMSAMCINLSNLWHYLGQIDRVLIWVITIVIIYIIYKIRQLESATMRKVLCLINMIDRLFNI